VIRAGKMDDRVPMDCIRCQTVLAKALGPFDEWKDRLRVAHEAGYNMIHFTPIQELGASNSSYCIRDQLALNSAFSKVNMASFFVRAIFAAQRLQMCQPSYFLPECSHFLAIFPPSHAGFMKSRFLQNCQTIFLVTKCQTLPAENATEHIIAGEFAMLPMCPQTYLFGKGNAHSLPHSSLSMPITHRILSAL